MEDSIHNYSSKSVFKYCSNSEYTYNNIKNGEFYLALPSELNDMFEMLPYFDIQQIENIFLKIYNNDSYKYELPNFVDEELIGVLKHTEIKGREDLINLIRITTEWYKQSLRIGSLTTNPNSPVMWGLYGSNNTGLLIEYDINEFNNQLSNQIILSPVNYSERKHSGIFEVFCLIRGLKNLNKKDAILFWNSALENVLTKYNKWSYEEEMRVVSFDPGVNSLKVLPKSITIGSAMPLLEKVKYCELANELNIPIMYADVLDEEMFGVKSILIDKEKRDELYKVTNDNSYLDVHKIVKSLSNKRPVFYSEADFQFAFAKEVELLYPSASVRLEYISNKIKGMHIDIWVSLHGYVIPIELKYKTKEASISYNNEQFDLKSHSANNLGMYDVIRDIERIEKVKMVYDNCREGYVICITNDQGYYNKRNIDGRVQYEDFCISQDKQIPKYPRWKLDPSPGTIKGRTKEINLTKEYACNWNDYSQIEEIGFKSIVFKVDNT